jgi:hypothetical protein
LWSPFNTLAQEAAFHRPQIAYPMSERAWIALYIIINIKEGGIADSEFFSEPSPGRLNMFKMVILSIAHGHWFGIALHQE